MTEARDEIFELRELKPQLKPKSNGHGQSRSGEARGYYEPRLKLVPWDEITLGTDRRYLAKGLIPRVGLTVVWGPPKCGKSFWAFDLALHVALGWVYRGRCVQQGAVVYCAFEGQEGFKARKEAFCRRFLQDNPGPVPFYLLPVKLDLVAEYRGLIAAIKAQLGDINPALVVLDTLNRSLRGSESSDEDMAAYVKASDAIRAEFECAVAIVHHCGIEGTRPRGHTSLTGAADAQLSVKRDAAGNVIVAVEWMKDGPDEGTVVSRLQQVEVGIDEDGDVITSCVVVPADEVIGTAERKLTKNLQTMFSILQAAGQSGLTTEDWNSKAREVGLGAGRKADLYDFRQALIARGLVRQHGSRWTESDCKQRGKARPAQEHMDFDDGPF